MYNSMNVCKWCMSGSATENSILLSVLPRLNKIFNQSINLALLMNNTSPTPHPPVTISITNNFKECYLILAGEAVNNILLATPKQIINSPLHVQATQPNMH